MSTNHNFWRERRAEAVSHRGPSAYQPTALPLGQTGSLRPKYTKLYPYNRIPSSPSTLGEAETKKTSHSCWAVWMSHSLGWVTLLDVINPWQQGYIHPKSTEDTLSLSSTHPLHHPCSRLLVGALCSSPFDVKSLKNYNKRIAASTKPMKESRKVFFCPFCLGCLWRKVYTT